MANNDSLIVKSTVGTTVNSKSITDINPNATDAELSAFATALYSLTTNNVSAVTKVTKRDIVADGLYPLVLSTSISNPTATNVLTKVDDTHYTLNMTAFEAQQQPAAIEINATVNSQAMRPSTVTYTTPIAAGTAEGYGIMFESGGHNGASTMDIAFMSESDLDVDTVVTGDYLVTFNAGTFGDYNYGSATITVTVTKGA